MCAVAAASLAGTLAAQSGPLPAAPWWTDYTTTATDPRGKDIGTIGAKSYRSFCYGGWYGLWYFDFQNGSPATARKLIQDAGAKPIAYYDLGEVGDFAVLVGDDNKLIVNAWNWQTWAGQPGKTHWFGLQSFMENSEWAPYPTAKAFDLPAFTTPDGAPIPPGKLYDVLGRQWIDGTLHFMESSNSQITDEIATASGLATVSHRQKGGGDVQGGNGWATMRLVSLDRANPQLRAYDCRESAEFIKRFRPAGVFVDNLGDTDTLIPMMMSFGQWSSHNFREFLRSRMTANELQACGIENVNTFEIRDYMSQGDVSGGKLNSNHLRDPRWLDDKIWKAYLVYKVETGLEYGREVYHAAKAAAAEVGLDCGIFGNIIPMFPGSELARGFCDVPCFEWLAEGTYSTLPELGLPPKARSAYVVRLARTYSGTSYCWFSLYVPKRLSGPKHVNLHKVQAFECFSNGGIMDYGQWYLDRYSPGTDESAGYINRFIDKVAPRASGRDFAADIGLVYCSWTLVATIDGLRPVPELFLNEYKGWTDYLCNARLQWNVVLSQDLAAGGLERFKVIVLPSILSITDQQVDALQRYVERGGRIVVTGHSGTRYGPDQFLTSRRTNALAQLAHHPRVHWTSGEPGAEYFTGKDQTAAGKSMADLLVFDGFEQILTTDAPKMAEVSLWRPTKTPGFILDLVNNNIDVESDRITAAPACKVTLKPGSKSRAFKVSRVQLITADADGISEIADLPADAWQFSAKTGELVLRVPSFTYYAMVFID